MKKLVITTISIIIASSAMAQNTSGKISYTETLKMNIQLKDEDVKGSGMTVEQLAAFMPKEQAMPKVLYYNTEGALYQDGKKETSDATTQNGNMQMVINFGGGESKVYRDMKENKTIEQLDFMSRKFLVTSDIKKTDWKMTGKQKEILGYPCQQATAMKDTQQVTAWFTSAIPVSAGPIGMGGLPGMILEMEVGHDLSIIANKVEPGEVSAKMLAKPTEGKKVSKEQYEKIVMDKMKEMQAENGGHGGVIIKTEIRN